MGKAQTLLFAKEGAQIIVADMNLEEAGQTVSAIKKDGGDGIAIQVNVTDEGSIEELLKTSIEKIW